MTPTAARRGRETKSGRGLLSQCHPPLAALASRLYRTESPSRQTALRVGVLAGLHLAAFAILIATEGQLIPAVAFMLFWGLLNFLLLTLVARPMVAAALSLAMLAVLILLSQFKHEILLTTVNFVDLMVIDGDTFSFLMQIFPRLGLKVAVAVALADRACPALALRSVPGAAA